MKHARKKENMPTEREKALAYGKKSSCYSFRAAAPIRKGGRPKILERPPIYFRSVGRRRINYLPAERTGFAFASKALNQKTKKREK